MKPKTKLSFLIFLISVAAFSDEIIQYPELERKLASIPGREGIEIRYGFDLLVHTPKYFGPRGTLGVKTQSRMACSQCHMEVGSKIFGNSWLDSHSIYPMFRWREGKIQTLTDRINACFKHPLQSKPLDKESREMKAIEIYFKWLGRGRQMVGEDKDDRLMKIAFLNRSASRENGAKVYQNRCQLCHGNNGQGRLSDDKKYFIYPPLWGKESFMLGSSMSRLSIFARFVKANMPFGATAEKPELSDEEAWDVGAYVLSQKRPAWVGKVPFGELTSKPFDYPLGPYPDQFSQEQHLLGPFLPIINFFEKDGKVAPKSSLGI